MTNASAVTRTLRADPATASASHAHALRAVNIAGRPGTVAVFGARVDVARARYVLTRKGYLVDRVTPEDLRVS